MKRNEKYLIIAILLFTVLLSYLFAGCDVDFNKKSGYLNYEIKDLTVIPLDGKIYLSWVEPNNKNFKESLVYIGIINENNKNLSLYTEEVNPAGTYIKNLKNGYQYDITVVARDLFGHESIGVHVTATPMLKYRQPPVTQFRKEIGKGEICLSWKSPSNPDFAGVEVSATDLDGKNVDHTFVPCEKGKEGSIIIGRLTSGYNYNFYAQAKDIWGNLSEIEYIEGNPDGTPPPKPIFIFDSVITGDTHYQLIEKVGEDPFYVYRLNDSDLDVAQGQRLTLYWKIQKVEDFKETEVWYGIEGLGRSIFATIPASAATDETSPYFWKLPQEDDDNLYYKCEIPNLRNGIHYRMSLVALDNPGNGVFLQTEKPLVTQDGVAIKMPSQDDIKISPASNQLKISFKRPIEGDFEKTEIRYYQKTLGADEADILSLKANETGKVLTNLLNGENYLIQFNFWDSSDNCTTVEREAIPTADAIPTVLELSVAKKDKSLTAYWKTPNLNETKLSKEAGKEPLYAVYCAEDTDAFPDSLNAIVNFNGGNRPDAYDTGDQLISNDGKLFWVSCNPDIVNGINSVEIPNLINETRYKVAVFLAGVIINKGATASVGETVIGIPDIQPGPNTSLVAPVDVPFKIGSVDAPKELSQIALSYVPAGAFKMGIKFYADEPHWVNFTKGFWIGQHEISYGIWRTVYEWATNPERGDKVYTFKHRGIVNNGSLGFAGAELNIGGVLNPKLVEQIDPEFYNLPASGMSWYDAIIWCNALTEYANEKTNSNMKCVYVKSDAAKTPLRNATDKEAFTTMDQDIRKPEYQLDSKDGFALPTEAQWEYSAKYLQDENGVALFMPGSKVSGDCELYNEMNSQGVETMSQKFINAKEEGGEPIMKSVYAKEPNFIHCFNMNGNVAEWCFDWYAKYEPDAVENPLGTLWDEDSLYANHKVIRGGSCFESFGTLGTGFRGKDKMDQPDFRIGLRVCRNNVKIF